jgi:peptidoglycan/xylan/chitin deacetylase (PgdA/CDA1 family)
MSATVGNVTRRQALAAGIGAVASAALMACGSGRPDRGALATDTTAATGPASGSASGAGAAGSAQAVSSTTVAPVATVTDLTPDPSAVAAAHDGLVATQWGLDVSGVHTRLVDAGPVSAPTLALTFDACGGPGGSGVDEDLLAVLTGSGVAATLFLNLRWIEANRGVAERLAANPLFELGNHGSRHLPLSVDGRSAYGIAGTQSAAEAADEVWANHQALTELTGTPPKWFRSGTAHYDEVATSIAVDLGEQPVGFTTNGDLGATASAAQVTAELVAAPAGGIVIAHMNQPGSGTAAGVAAALGRLQAARTRWVTLSGGGGTRP